MQWYRLPLAEDLPEFLSASGMRTPAVRVLLAVFIRQHRFKGPSMQIQVQHIFRRESEGRKSGDKQLVDHPLALHPNGWGRGGCRMGCDNQAQTRPAWGQGNFKAIVQGARRSALRMSTLLVWWTSHTNPHSKDLH